MKITRIKFSFTNHWKYFNHCYYKFDIYITSPKNVSQWIVFYILNLELRLEIIR